MDPIDRVNFIIVSWENWVKKNKTFKYHGISMRCKDGFFYVPDSISPIISPTPPIYYEYQYTPSETFGFVKIQLQRHYANFGVFFDDHIEFNNFSPDRLYDQIIVTITSPKCDGSFSLDFDVWENPAGIEVERVVYDNSIYASGRILYQNIIYSAKVDKWHWVDSKTGQCYWVNHGTSSSLSRSIILNWRYYPTTKKYDLWDNQGGVLLNQSITKITIDFLADIRWGTRIYPCYALHDEKITVSNLKIYSGNFDF